MTDDGAPSRPDLIVELKGSTLRMGPLAVTFQRTLRIPDDGRDYPLPPGLGALPVCRVADHLDAVPESWRAHGGVFMPMHPREALWLEFSGDFFAPVALKVAAGMRNALSGAGWDDDIRPGRPQDYIVVPGQRWLDGFNTGDGTIRQFIAMPLGMGYTAEGQLTGEEFFGGIQLLAFRAVPGKTPSARADLVSEAWDLDVVEFDDEAANEAGLYEGKIAGRAASMKRYLRRATVRGVPRLRRIESVPPAGSIPIGCGDLGLAAGGRMTQDIIPDPYGPGVWDTERRARVYVHIVDAALYKRITGRSAPDSPITAEDYTRHGLPWFTEYDSPGDIPASSTLSGVKSVAEKDAEHGFTVQDDSSITIPDSQVKGIPAQRPGSFSDTVN